jgi:hypothetical protein
VQDSPLAVVTGPPRGLGRVIGARPGQHGYVLVLARCAIPSTTIPRPWCAPTDPAIDDYLARAVVKIAWRGIWFPRLDMSGPTIR